MIEEELKKFLGKYVRFNESLASYTTYKIGGPVRYFVMAKNKDILLKAINFAKENDVPCFILAGGSNILVSDMGFSGMVVKIDFQKITVDKEKKQIIAEAGASLSKIIQKAVSNSLTGMEFAYGLPGTLGGAIRGNAGCFGKTISEKVLEAKVLEDCEKKTFTFADCQFSYRNSIFKQNPKLIILDVTLQLKEGDAKRAKEIMQKNLSLRKTKHPLDFPSAGCVFQNPKDSPAGALIEKAELKGRIMGGAQISEKHANFIVNKGRAKANDVYKLMKLAQKEVYKKFKIRLKPEIQLLGEFKYQKPKTKNSCPPLPVSQSLRDPIS